MRKVIRVLRSTSLLIVICISLLTSTVALAAWTISLTTQVATVTAGAAAAAVAHRQAMARALARAKAKARLRRVMAAIPLVGIGVAAEFERRDYLEWKRDNPKGTAEQYGCEVAAMSAEVMDDVLQDLPDAVRPNPDMLLSLVAPAGGADACGAVPSDTSNKKAGP
ncbi:MAG: hypothetical protein AAF141_03520 [Pseudomonadota bacterium]